MPSLAPVHDFTFKMCTTNGTTNLPFCYEVVLEKKNELIGSHRLLIYWFLLIDLEMRRNYNQEQSKEKRELEELLHSARVFPPIWSISAYFLRIFSYTESARASHALGHGWILRVGLRSSILGFEV